MKILIVDDEKFFADNLRLLLNLETNHSIQLAFDGNEASGLITKEMFDIYILDLNLPSKSGIELATEILINNKLAKIIFMSAYSNLINNIKSTFPNFKILEKPFEINELINLIN